MTNFVSEAQAYQAIRRDWKRTRNNAQRVQNCLMWEHLHKEKHPEVLSNYEKMMKLIGTIKPVINKDALRQAWHQQGIVSEMDQLLNKYGVKYEN